MLQRLWSDGHWVSWYKYDNTVIKITYTSMLWKPITVLACCIASRTRPVVVTSQEQPYGLSVYRRHWTSPTANMNHDMDYGLYCSSILFLTRRYALFLVGYRQSPESCAKFELLFDSCVDATLNINQTIRLLVFVFGLSLSWHEFVQLFELQ